MVTKVSTDEEKTPLSDVEFLVTTSDGTVVGDANGKFVTDSSGSFLVEGIDPGTTLVVRETRSKPGYLMDDTPQTAVIQAGQTVKLEFRNQPLGNLVIEKWGRNGTSTVPLEGVKFEIKYANGQYVDAAGGTLSSNGIYYTDSTGKIILSSITGTVVVTELESVPGYCIMSGRMDDQPPKQRFFYYPFFAACVWMVYTKGKAISAAKQSHRYQFSAECRSILLGYIQTFSYCCFQSPHCLLPGLSHQYPKSGREYQRDQSSSCR